MADLVEALREVRDLHHEEAYYRGDRHVAAAAYAAAGAANDATTTTTTTTAAAKGAPLYVRVVRAYVRCFAAIVGYHDARRELLVGKDDAAAVATTGDGGAGGRTARGGIVARCAISSDWGRTFRRA